MPKVFNLLPFPQSFDGSLIHLRVLVMPILRPGVHGDPRDPLIKDPSNPTDTDIPFADAETELEVATMSGFADRPRTSLVSTSGALTGAGGHSPHTRPLYDALVADGRFKLDPVPPGSSDIAGPAPANLRLRKYLPLSYRSSFAFTGPRARGAVIDDSYRCAIDDAPPATSFVESPDTVNWGQIYAYCLRNRALAERLGLIRAGTFDPGVDFEEGGFLWIDLEASSDYKSAADAMPDMLGRYAARIPRLEPGTARPLYGAVLFPVWHDAAALPEPPGSFDIPLIEAAAYDDGFAKIVHVTQPVSQNLLAEEPDGFAPVTDIGFRLGWDDEQLLTWYARQLREDPDSDPGKRLDAPLGVLGYRIDVQDPETGKWHSLTDVRSKEPLELDGHPLVSPPGQFHGELAVEVHPQQFDGRQPAEDLWLPAYLAQWSGGSVVLPDAVAARLFKTDTAHGGSVALGDLYEPADPTLVALRYGMTYAFRVRMVDPTGGGPTLTHDRVHAAPAGEALKRFVRHVVPEPVRVSDPDADPGMLPYESFTGTKLEIRRPPLGYPAVVFTGKYPDPIQDLIDAAAAAAGRGRFGIPDPDVDRVIIDVEVRALAMDNALSMSGKDPYALLYTTTRQLSPGAENATTIPLDFRDVPSLNFDVDADGALGLTQQQIDSRTALPLPTAREARLTIRGLGSGDGAYWAAGADVGQPLQVKVARRPSQNERDLIVGPEIRGIYLQPASPPIPTPSPIPTGTPEPPELERIGEETGATVQRLAQQLGVDHKGLTLVGPRGKRVVFGCSRGIRHTMAPDNSSMTISAKEDLFNHWIVAITFVVDRDWTWNGLEPVSFDVFRTKKFAQATTVDDNGKAPIGDVEVVATAPVTALDQPDRSHARVVFLDAVEPKQVAPPPPAPPVFPDCIELEYRVAPRFLDTTAAHDDDAELSLTLPVTTPPSQVPALASAGLALSPYVKGERYASTEPRRRFLWLEFDEPPEDPNDALFIRMLAYAPDPLLAGERFAAEPPPLEPPLPVDPELIRVIAPDGVNDSAGLDAMVELKRSDTSDRHYLVPLPPGLNADSQELFGLFTYELRMGHTDRIWSTAQGRFGRPLRCTGVQHPAPTLAHSCLRTRDGLGVEAPFATAVAGGENVTANPPRTQLWGLLFAQALQADGEEWRNVLLDDRQLEPPPVDGPGGLRPDEPLRGSAYWQREQLHDLLMSRGLPLDSSLSVLCVEVMPTKRALQQRDRPDYDGRELPLSAHLGHHRVLRTSPLVAVPDVC